MHRQRGFTLIELLVIIVVAGMLGALAFPAYITIKEKAADREAKASLALIQVAQKSYRLENGCYYPCSSTTSNINNINTNLRLRLPAVTPEWAISLNCSLAGGEFATATRLLRTWRINLPAGSAETATCSGSGCSS
jgi:prepilin-type N-terminal cleavage/methylation domain-containing protein